MEADYLPVYSIPEDIEEFKLVCEEGFSMIRPCPLISISGAIIVQLIDKLIYFQSFGCYGMNYLKRYLNKVKRSKFRSFPKLTSILEQIEENTASQSEYREALEKSKSLYEEISEFSKELISFKTRIVDENDSELNMFSREFGIDFWIYSSDDCQKISNSIIPNPILITLFQIDKETEIEFSVLHHNLELLDDNDPSFSFPYLVENKISKPHKEEYKIPEQKPAKIILENSSKISEKIVGEIRIPQKEEKKDLPNLINIGHENKSKAQKEEHKKIKQEPAQIPREISAKKPDSAIISIEETLQPPKEEEEDLAKLLNIGNGSADSHQKDSNPSEIPQNENITKGNPNEFLVQVIKKGQEKVKNVQPVQAVVQKERHKPKSNLQYNPRNFMLPQNSGRLYEEHKIPFDEAY